ncbi:hypothetical protein F3Y22_tig00110987pilonHSYRG00284 [Hibiscus syriacus]|uniref:Uncharacterized protein n=1 Tax=Hibiscus syriacus TaxID=106335 RepID=A0A6A2ZBI7_HIBSY|nr:hypothetical protein F3Y22_tig00110987pilonHSYRG00284 [Hibiscus syriacus]
MIGYGVPTEPDQITQRTLPEDAIGSPYFYYEQIHLSNPMIGFGVHTKSDQILKEHFQKMLLSLLIYYDHMALAPVNVWTGISQSMFLLSVENGNLVWVGRNKIVPLEPDEVEMLIGFPKNHTRGSV